uniref:Uncharacterized protein n=1 Tax=Candidatus Kentrum sp. LFY TaxID=2126342 RepID=A0A450U6Z1_9GAMM|nr:MAG: hypothetical protein BECKLFY1418A_GA0070994_1001102 [Candidatus Kentron sp. LFY]
MSNPELEKHKALCDYAKNSYDSGIHLLFRIQDRASFLTTIIASLFAIFGALIVTIIQSNDACDYLQFVISDDNPVRIVLYIILLVFFIGMISSILLLFYTISIKGVAFQSIVDKNFMVCHTETSRRIL